MTTHELLIETIGVLKLTVEALDSTANALSSREYTDGQNADTKRAKASMALYDLTNKIKDEEKGGDSD